jgi:menaquinone-specific isochorismate synthase
MALAGTKASHLANELLSSNKDIREHTLVVNALKKNLSPFGEIKLGEIFIKTQGRLAHLCTPIEVNLRENPSDDEILKAIHPTPALGAYPWNHKSQKRLKQIRDEIKIYPEFGAPFGIKTSDFSFFIVAIRNAHIFHEELQIGSGCGVINESNLEAEWNELLLKQRAIRENLQL